MLHVLPGHGCKAQRHLPHAVPVDAVHHIWSTAAPFLLLLLLLHQDTRVLCTAMLLLWRLGCPEDAPINMLLLLLVLNGLLWLQEHKAEAPVVQVGLVRDGLGGGRL